MGAYIISKGIVSPQSAPSGKDWLDEMIIADSPMLRCVEPDYKDLIAPIHLRKMPRILKIGLYAGMKCIRESGNRSIDATVVGTGFGCLEDLEKFLRQVLENSGQPLFPGSFINSTHSLVGAQLAVMTKNQHYNMNYIHRSFSFEHALSDALLLLEEKEANNILAGCSRITEYNFDLYKHLDTWKPAKFRNSELFDSNSNGTIAGEGSAFFVLSNNPDNAFAELKGVHTIYKPQDLNEIRYGLNEFLASSGIGVDDIDILISGNNGDEENDRTYSKFIDQCLMKKTNVLLYKHLCGEYHTASGFALAVAEQILRYQHVPAKLKASGIPEGKIKKILLYNQYKNIEHSFILVGLKD